MCKVFLPSGQKLHRLIRQQAKLASATVYAGDRELYIDFDARRISTLRQADLQTTGVYIPPKEMLANAPGFLSLYGGSGSSL